jgi:two-component system chemotaxis response regulator CheB
VGGIAVTIRALIADDSAFFREVLKDELERDGDIRVVAEAVDGAAAVDAAERIRPDLVTIDLLMPGMSGLEAIEELMAHHPVPIVVLTSQPVGAGSALVFEATRRGALVILEKGVVARRPEWFREQIRLLARVKVVRHLKPAPAPRATSPCGGAAIGGRRLVGIGASAGGPPAVAEILSALPSDFPGCIAVVQHLSTGFAPSYARFLQQSTALHVQLVDGPCPIQAGHVLVAPDDRHLILQGDRFALSDTSPDSGLRPSVDALFSSLAGAAGRAAVGVILSGMGDDGARGAERLARAGGLVIAQDEETSAVFGMPKAAVSAAPGACVLPVQEIGLALVRATSRELLRRAASS